MGYIGHTVDNNPLWGHKSDLKEKLSEDNPPGWICSSRDWKKKKKEMEKRDKDHIYIRFGDKYGNRKESKKDLSRAPDRVKQKCLNWLDENRDGIEYRDGANFVEFRYFMLEVEFTRNRNVKNLRMVAWFKDH